MRDCTTITLAVSLYMSFLLFPGLFQSLADTVHRDKETWSRREGGSEYAVPTMHTYSQKLKLRILQSQVFHDIEK